jgi:TPR repeat protein
MWNTPVEVQFTSAGCLNYPCRTPYASGHGVPQDYVTAHMWFGLSAAQDDDDAAKNRDVIAQRMTPAQIAAAQKLTREWKPKPYGHQLSDMH